MVTDGVKYRQYMTFLLGWSQSASKVAKLEAGFSLCWKCFPPRDIF